MNALIIVTLCIASATTVFDLLLVAVALVDRDRDLAEVSLPNLLTLVLAIVTLAVMLAR